MTEYSSLVFNHKDAKLLVIDAQNDVCHTKGDYAGSISSSGEMRDVTPIQRAVDRAIIPFLSIARESGLPIAFIQSIYETNQYPKVSEKWLTIDDEAKDPYWRVKIYRDMPEPTEPIYQKDTNNPFTYQEKENGLEEWLHDTMYVLVAGFVSYGCVKTGVDALFERRYIPVVLKDCAAASAHAKGRHEKVMKEYRAHDIIRVVNSKNVKFST